MGQLLEVVVLGPEGGLVREGGGVDQGVRHCGFVLHTQGGGGERDGGIRWNHDALLEKIDELLRAGFVGVDRRVFPDFVEGDGGNDDLREVARRLEKSTGIRALVSDFDPGGTIEANGLHGRERSVFSRSNGLCEQSLRNPRS